MFVRVDMSRIEPIKTRSRRNEIRADVKKRQPAPAHSAVLAALRCEKSLMVLGVAALFVVACSSILMLRPQVLTLRPGQRAFADVTSRVEFSVLNDQQLQRARERARVAEPRVYEAADVDPFSAVEERLLALPKATQNLSLEQLDAPERDVLDEASLTKLQEVAETQDAKWAASVRRFVSLLRESSPPLIPAAARSQDWQHNIRLPDGRVISADQTLSPLAPAKASAASQEAAAGPAASRAREAMAEQLARKFQPPAADAFSPLLYPKMLDLMLAVLGPTYEVDAAATAKARQAAADRVPESAGVVGFKPGQVLVPAGQDRSPTPTGSCCGPRTTPSAPSSSPRRSGPSASAWSAACSCSPPRWACTAHRFQPRILQQPGADAWGSSIDPGRRRCSCPNSRAWARGTWRCWASGRSCWWR